MPQREIDSLSGDGAQLVASLLVSPVASVVSRRRQRRRSPSLRFFLILAQQQRHDQAF
jgi:hypothetical protein